MIRRLHIGGKYPTPGWEILNAVDGPHVNHHCNAKDMSIFPDSSFNDIYASHVLEHFDYLYELPTVLAEWNRVLKPFGRLYVSVPDLEILSLFFLYKQASESDHFEIMRMIFGGHTDIYDYHLIGFNESILKGYLATAGFGMFKRVDEFGMFPDNSCYKINDRLISINLIAKKI